VDARNRRSPGPGRRLANTLCAVTGITNKSLRALMTGLLGTVYTTNQACGMPEVCLACELQ